MGSPRWSIFRRTKDPEYHLVSFLMKATVWANVLEDKQTIKIVDTNGIITDQKRPESDQKSDQMHQILDLIKKNPRISRAELSEKTGLHGSSMTRRRIPSMRFQRPPASAVRHYINM